MNKPKKKLDLIGKFGFPNPIQGKVSLEWDGSLVQEVFIGRFASESAISSKEPVWRIINDRVIIQESVFNPSSNITRKTGRQGLKVKGVILPV